MNRLPCCVCSLVCLSGLFVFPLLRARAQKLKDKTYELAKNMGDDYIVLEIPEANGVDVFNTCLNLGINLEMYPQSIIRKVMIVGKKK